MTSESVETKSIAFWDLEDYKIPQGLTPSVIAENVKTALVGMGFHGPVKIKAYCDETNHIHEVEDGFLAAGIKLKHVPEGRSGKDCSRDKEIMYGMFSWGMKNGEEPTNVMVISENLFASFANTLRQKNHNVLWTKLSAQGIPIAQSQSGISSERLDNSCCCCGIKIEHDH